MKKLSITLSILLLIFSTSCSKASSQATESKVTETAVTEEQTTEIPETEETEGIKETVEKTEETETESANVPPLSESIEITVQDGTATADFNSLYTVISLSFYGSDAENALKDTADLIGIMGNALNTVGLEDDQDHLRIPDKEYSGDLKELVDIANEYSEDTEEYFSLKLQDEAGEDSLNIRDIYKGYTANKLTDELSKRPEEELSGALVLLGGNATVIGKKPNGKPWKVGIQDPNGEPGSYIAVVSIDEKFMDSFNGSSLTVASKGTYSLSNGNSRVIDPKTGQIANSGIVASSVISSDAALADAFGSAVVVMGYDKAVEFWKESNENFEMVLVDENKNIYVTEGMKDNLKSDGKLEIIRKE